MKCVWQLLSEKYHHSTYDEKNYHLLPLFLYNVNVICSQKESNTPLKKMHSFLGTQSFNISCSRLIIRLQYKQY